MPRNITRALEGSRWNSEKRGIPQGNAAWMAFMRNTRADNLGLPTAPAVVQKPDGTPKNPFIALNTYYFVCVVYSCSRAIIPPREGRFKCKACESWYRLPTPQQAPAAKKEPAVTPIAVHRGGDEFSCWARGCYARVHVPQDIKQDDLFTCEGCSAVYQADVRG